MSYNVRTALQDNINSLRIVLENEGKKLTTQQLEVVKRFGGWNNKIVLYDPYIDSEWETASKQDQIMRPMLKELHELLKWNMTGKQYTEAINSIRNACLTSYYSPEVLPATFYRVLSEYHKVQQMIEPSCGSGVFVNHVWKWFPDITTITMYEKDLLTGKLLQRITEGTIPKGVWRDVHIKPFEESDAKENGQYQLVSSNVPFGQMNVFDNSVPYYSLCNRIHCYFFAKGLDKLANGGILGFLVSNAFLDSSGNKEAREYVFTHSDFISLTVMPDNLMQESNTTAPSHFLVCRKRVGKTEMSPDEKLLCESKYMKLETGAMCSMNCYIAEHPEIIIGTVKAGKNQYGKGAREVWWDGDISGISSKFAEILEFGFSAHYKKEETVEELLLYTWEEEDNGLTDVENEARLKEMEMGEGKYADEEELRVRDTCVNCGRLLVLDEETMCHECYPSTENRPPWETDEETGAPILTLDKLQEQGSIDSIMAHIPETTIDQLQINIPYKQGMIVKRTLPDTLFTNKEELVVVQSLEPLVVVPVEGGKSDKEKLMAYVEIRDTYIKMEEMEEPEDQNDEDDEWDGIVNDGTPMGKHVQPRPYRNGK